MKLPPQIERYLVAMNASAFDAGVRALVLFCGMAGGHQLDATIPAMTAQQLPWVFVIAFGRACLAYLDAHPVTALVEDLEGGSQKSEVGGQNKTGEQAPLPPLKISEK